MLSISAKVLRLKFEGKRNSKPPNPWAEKVNSPRGLTTASGRVSYRLIRVPATPIPNTGTKNSRAEKISPKARTL